MTVTVSNLALRVPCRVNDNFLADGAPASVIDFLAEKRPGRVFLFIAQPWAMPGFTPGVKGESFVVLEARECTRTERVEVLCMRPHEMRRRAVWRAVPQDSQEGYVYAR